MKTQAWGWLTVAVLAAGLNANYHNGGMEWAHRLAGRIGHRSSAVLALATGNADRFFTEARIIEQHERSSACPLAALASADFSDMEIPAAKFDVEVARFQAMSDREQARLDRFAAQRDRIQAKLATLRIPAVAVNPVVMEVPEPSACRRIRVKVPRINVNRQVVHVEVNGPGPV